MKKLWKCCAAAFVLGIMLTACSKNEDSSNSDSKTEQTVIDADNGNSEDDKKVLGADNENSEDANDSSEDDNVKDNSERDTDYTFWVMDTSIETTYFDSDSQSVATTQYNEYGIEESATVEVYESTDVETGEFHYVINSEDNGFVVYKYVNDGTSEEDVLSEYTETYFEKEDDNTLIKKITNYDCEEAEEGQITTELIYEYHYDTSIPDISNSLILNLWCKFSSCESFTYSFLYYRYNYIDETDISTGELDYIDKTVYYYTGDGKCTGTETYRDDELQSSITYKFEQNGNLVYSYNEDNDLVFEYEYTDDGVITKCTGYYGKESPRYVTNYNDDGMVTETYTYYDNGNIMTYQKYEHGIETYYEYYIDDISEEPYTVKTSTIKENTFE